MARWRKSPQSEGGSKGVLLKEKNPLHPIETQGSLGGTEPHSARKASEFGATLKSKTWDKELQIARVETLAWPALALQAWGSLYCLGPPMTPSLTDKTRALHFRANVD